MHKQDRGTMIKTLMKLKLTKKLLERLRDSEIQTLFSVLNRYTI
jgi:hypothetical protein